VSRYGYELARLFHAKTCATKAYDIARKGGVSPSVVQDAKGLVDALTQNIARAERDNDLIYHQDVPSISSLDIIAPAGMAKSTTPAGLLEPQSVLEKANESVIFGELLPWGAKEAISKCSF
jgi:programmed cell death 6-interacting protein